MNTSLRNCCLNTKFYILSYEYKLSVKIQRRIPMTQSGDNRKLMTVGFDKLKKSGNIMCYRFKKIPVHDIIKH